MKRPLGFVALCYGSGLVLAEFAQPTLQFLFAVSFAAALAAILVQRTRHVLIWPLILLTGWTNLASRTAVISPHDLRAILESSAEDVVVRGRLAETPNERTYLRDGKETVRTLAEVSLNEIKRSGEWRPANGRIAITVAGKLQAACFEGQTVEVSGIIAPPRPPSASGLFDYKTYLKRQGIHFEMKSSPDEWQLLSLRRSPPFSDRFLTWARATLARGLPEVDKPVQLLWAMTLGSKNVVSRDVYVPFTQSGTMHIFAISGLHVALIAGILVCLCRVSRIPRGWCGAVVIPLLWFYAGATGWQSSAVRSTLMMSIVISGWSLKRPSDLLNSLAAAALIILVWDPQQLFQAGFQLSFLVVLSIALILPPLEKIRDRWLMHDLMLPAGLVPVWKRWLGAPLRFVATGFATSIAAWLGSWPITAHYFHLFSPVTLLANVAIVPAAGAALASNLASLLCGVWLPAASTLFNHSAWFWMTLMMKTGEMSVRLPGAFFYVASPAVADFLIYYGVLIAVLTGAAFRTGWRKWTVAAMIAIPMFYGWRWQVARATTQITAIPFQGGSAIYCDAPGAANDLLVDCGAPQTVEFVLQPFLRAQGLNHLPRLALSHGDLHLISGAERLLTAMPVRQVVTSSARFRSPSYRTIVKSLETTPERWQKVNANDSIGDWTILHPARTDAFSHADDAALVFVGEFHAIRVLLLSELGRAGQDALLQSGADLRAELVISGIPGRGEPLCETLLDAIQPRLIVITDSEFPVSKRASASLKERLATRGIPVLYTRDSGTVSITLRRSCWRVRAGETEFQGTPSP
jgi:competence protein ComEC